AVAVFDRGDQGGQHPAAGRVTQARVEAQAGRQEAGYAAVAQIRLGSRSLYRPGGPPDVQRRGPVVRVRAARNSDRTSASILPRAAGQGVLDRPPITTGKTV